MISITTTVNGEHHTIALDGHESAVDVIRGQLGLTGTKLVCAGGVCGADITTVEGLSVDGELHRVQRAFLAHDCLQCGYCTPGFVVGAAAFVDRWRATNGTTEPDRHTIADALAGHLCRCGAYEGIHRAVAAACRGDFDDLTPVPIRADAAEVLVDLLGDDRRVRYAVQPIAAVAGPTLEAARRIAADLRVEITPLPS